MNKKAFFYAVLAAGATSWFFINRQQRLENTAFNNLSYQKQLERDAVAGSASENKG